MTNWLAVDFGTSNSAAAYWSDSENRIVHVDLEEGYETVPTAIFLHQTTHHITIGRQAEKAFLDGEDGRYMRSLKSVLGTSLMTETLIIDRQRIDFFEIISRFIAILKQRVEQVTSMTFDKVVAGRPVFFHNKDAERDKRARDQLEDCFKRAGFQSLVFFNEPDAAALSAADEMAVGATGLVVDVGGGTSDFTVFDRQRTETIIRASNGLRLGGTNFDQALSFHHVMPVLGRGCHMRREMGSGTIVAPNAIYSDLSTWEKIPFVYTRQNLKQVRDCVRLGVEPRPFERLAHLLDLELGHDLARAVEVMKIAANQTEGTIKADLGFVEHGLDLPIDQDVMAAILMPYEHDISEAIERTLNQAGCAAEDIDYIIPVGGSSLMQTVKKAIARTMPQAQKLEKAVFTSIVDGLAIRSGQIHEAST